MVKSALICFIIVILLNIQVSPLNVKMTNLQCSFVNIRFGEFTKCSIKAVKRDVSEMNIYAKVNAKPIYNAWLKLSFSKRGPYKYNSMYEYKINVCEFLKNSRRNPLAEIFYSFFAFQKYSNMNHTCPYDHDLIVDRCQLNMKPLSMLAVNKGEYKVQTTWYINQTNVAEVDISIVMY